MNIIYVIKTEIKVINIITFTDYILFYSFMQTEGGLA